LASSEALDVLHWVMRPALHRRICMVIEIVVFLPVVWKPGWAKKLLNVTFYKFFSI
jgi:hypothetical protein